MQHNACNVDATQCMQHNARDAYAMHMQRPWRHVCGRRRHAPHGTAKHRASCIVRKRHASCMHTGHTRRTQGVHAMAHLIIGKALARMGFWDGKAREDRRRTEGKGKEGFLSMGFPRKISKNGREGKGGVPFLEFPTKTNPIQKNLVSKKFQSGLIHTRASPRTRRKRWLPPRPC